MLEEKLKSAETLIDQLKKEREQLLECKKHAQGQLIKALEIGAPIGKLLTDQHDVNEGRAIADRKVIEAAVRREAAEKILKAFASKLRETREENKNLKLVC